MEEEKIYNIWLSSISGVGYKTFYKLIEYFGDAKSVYNANYSEIRNAVGNEKLFNSIIENKKNDPYKYIEKLDNLNIKVYTILDNDYPVQLKNIYDPPPVLYIRGNSDINDEMNIAIVGSRNATSYGKEMAYRLAYELSQNGIRVVSGLARGIDSFSHIGALKGAGKTIAVLGCGVNIIYPKENEKLMKDIIENGAVVSEFPLDFEPLPGNFPARNRVISGLSLGVVVVEAQEKSGSLITAKFALEQGREVFAVPGNATSAYSRGTNELIKQGAKLVNDVNDILEEFNLRKDIVKRINDNRINFLNNEEKLIFEFINEAPREINEIIEHTKINAGKVNYVLSTLILKDLIIKLPGNKFEKKYFDNF